MSDARIKSMKAQYQLTEHWFRKFRVLSTFDNYPTDKQLISNVEHHFDAKVTEIIRLDSENHLFVMVNELGGNESIELLVRKV